VKGLTVNGCRPAPGKIAIVIPKDAYARRVPSGAHQSWKVETVCDIPAVAARDVCGVERRDKSRKPIGWESGIGVTKNVDVSRRSMLDSVSQIVDLLTARCCQSGDKHIASKSEKCVVCGIVLGFDNESCLVVSVVLIEDGLDVLLQFGVCAFARA